VKAKLDPGSAPHHFVLRRIRGTAAITAVMAGHSRPKDGVASLAYVLAIHALLVEALIRKTWMPGPSPGMTTEGS
jgi:hypothetical protein